MLKTNKKITPSFDNFGVYKLINSIVINLTLVKLVGTLQLDIHKDNVTETILKKTSHNINSGRFVLENNYTVDFEIYNDIRDFERERQNLHQS